MAQEPAKDMAESTRVGVPSKLTVSFASSSSSSPPRVSVSAANCCRNYASFRRSDAPVRFMYFNQDGRWTDFSTEVIASLKSAFLDRKPLVDLSITGSRYLFDFVRMSQTDFDSGSQRSIAWIDEKGKCFFPKIFVGEDFDLELNQPSQNPKMDIEIRIDANQNNSKRQREEPEVSSSLKGDVNKRQRLEKWPSCVRLLSEGHEVYATVRDYFLNGMRKADPGVTVSAIRQWVAEGPLERARVFTFQKQIEVTEAAPVRNGRANVTYAWYGAPVKDAESVLVHGFAATSKVYGPDSFGVGVYLSPVGLPHLSATLAEIDDNGERHIILCRVILGNLEQVVAGSQQDFPSSRFSDTGADDTANPRWYVVWPCNMSRHIIPVCVVSFKYSTQYMNGPPKGTPGIRYSFEKLLSKMRDSLPAAKLQEVETLYSALRARKLARDVFVKKMRLITGDELLMATIREIQGK